MQENRGYKVGKWIAKNPSASLIVLGAIAISIYVALYGKQNQTLPPPPYKVAEPTKEDPRVEACGKGLDQRRAQAKAEFTKKKFQEAYLLLDYCNGRMAKDSQEYKEYLQYATAHVKVVEADQARFAKAEKARKKKEGVSIGMSQQDALDSSWGRPNKVNRTTGSWGVHEQWVYDGGYLYFEDGTLTSIQN